MLQAGFFGCELGVVLVWRNAKHEDLFGAKFCAYPKQILVEVNGNCGDWQIVRYYGQTGEGDIMIYVMLVLVGLGVVFGKEPVTRDNMPEKAAHTATFTVDKGLLETFGNLMQASKQCYLYQPFDEEITVWGEKNNGKRTGNIRIEHVWAMAEHEMFIMIDMKEVDGKSTEVVVYNKDDTAQESLKQFPEWAKKVPDHC